MTHYVAGQVVKGKSPPDECPDGFYWRKVMGQDEFKLYPRRDRKEPAEGAGDAGGAAPLSIKRVADGVRHYMQHEEGFAQVVETANLSVKALQNLAAWAGVAAAARAERERVRTAALVRANAALKDAGLEIGPDGAVRPIPAA